VNLFGVGFYVDEFWQALFGAMSVSGFFFVLPLAQIDEQY
jgi:hypothetical protein